MTRSKPKAAPRGAYRKGSKPHLRGVLRQIEIDIQMLRVALTRAEALKAIIEQALRRKK